MPDLFDWPSSPLTFSIVVSALGFAVLAQLHCAAMCGPFVAAFTKSKTEFLLNQIGRVLAYMTLGALIGTIGRTLQPHPIAIVAMCIVIAITAVISLLGFFGLRIRRKSAAPSKFTRIAHGILNSIRLTVYRKPRAFLLGFATPLIPCGQLWMVMSFAALTGETTKGAAIGFIFALTTTPGLYGFTWIRNQAAKLPSQAAFAVRTVMIAFLLAGLTFSFGMATRAIGRTVENAANSSQTTPDIPPRCH